MDGVLCVGQNIFNPSQWSEEFQLGVGIVVAVIIIIANIVCIKIKKGVFRGGFNFLSGGLWGCSFFLILGLLVPKLNNMLTSFMGNNILKTGSVVFWIALIISIVLVIFLWLLAETWSDNFFAKLLAMIGFGAVHGIGLFLLVGLGIRIIVGAIVCFLVYCFFSGSSASDSTDSYIEQLEMQKEEEETKKAELKAKAAELEAKREAAKRAAMKQFEAEARDVTVNSTGDWVNVNGDWHRVVEK